MVVLFLYINVLRVHFLQIGNNQLKRHLWCGIIAILCELIIGIGLPLTCLNVSKIFNSVLYNTNFISIKPVINQLMGCYKEEYRWFAAYYLIYRQVLYGVNNLIDYCSGFWSSNSIINDTPFSKFTIMLLISILIMVVHLWFQPYKSKSLNILDSFILLSFVGFLISVLEYWNRITAVVFGSFPYYFSSTGFLTYFTKLKYLVIPGI